jgi:ABC-type spermidine/putrescine transport system permease subunit I
LVAPVAIYLALMLIVPVAVQAYFSFMSREQGEFSYYIVHRPTIENYARIIARNDLTQSLIWTTGSSLIVALGTIILGLPAAQFLARGRGRGKLLIEMALLLPLFGDIFLAYALMYALAPQGIVNWALQGAGLIDAPVRLAGTPPAAIAAMMLPALSVLLMRSALARVDPVYEEAARLLGAHPLRAWFTTTFALARVGVAGAFLLTFAGSVGAYTLPIILAGRYNIWMSRTIEEAYTFDNVPLASALSIALTLLSGALIYLYVRLSKPRSEAQRYVG